MKNIPCSLKFRKKFFYEEGIELLNFVSPNKYLPSTKITMNTRYNKNKIGIGYGEKTTIGGKGNNTPGPGQYKLPSVFNKNKQGRIPMN